MAQMTVTFGRDDQDVYRALLKRVRSGDGVKASPLIVAILRRALCPPRKKK